VASLVMIGQDRTTSLAPYTRVLLAGLLRPAKLDLYFVWKWDETVCRWPGCAVQCAALRCGAACWCRAAVADSERWTGRKRRA
jgi:hypothetical protein